METALTIIAVAFAIMALATCSLGNSRGNLDETQGTDEHDDNITD